MNSKLPIKVIIVLLFLTIGITGWFYRSSFKAYFFQDDWFSLRISKVSTFPDFIKFIIPRKDVIYYRPIGMQLPFFVLERLFGANPIPFHLLTYITHAVNIILVFILMRLILKNDFKSLLIAFLYGTSLVHYIPFFWSATYAFVLGPTFFLASFILFFLFIQKKKLRYFGLSNLSFSLGLLTNEILIIFPLILFVYLINFRKKNEFKYVASFVILSIFFLVFRFILFPPPALEAYQLSLDKYALINLKAYLLWSLNWPEDMKDQFITFFKINPQFIKQFSSFFYVFVGTLLFNILFLFIIPLGLAIYKNFRKIYPILLLGISWFIIGLLPVLFFPQHSFSYYLPISLMGLMLVLTEPFSYLIKTVAGINRLVAYFLILGIIINWLFTLGVAIKFNSEVHWASRRAKFAEAIIVKAKKLYPPDNPDYPYIYLKPDSEIKLALNDQDGFKVIYQDEKIVTVYKNVIKKNLIGVR